MSLFRTEMSPSELTALKIERVQLLMRYINNSLKGLGDKKHITSSEAFNLGFCLGSKDWRGLQKILTELSIGRNMLEACALNAMYAVVEQVHTLECELSGHC